MDMIFAIDATDGLTDTDLGLLKGFFWSLANWSVLFYHILLLKICSLQCFLLCCKGQVYFLFINIIFTSVVTLPCIACHG